MTQAVEAGIPVGATLTAEGALFRIWAPGAERLDLLLSAGDSGTRSLPMSRDDAGYFSLLVADASPGDRYRYRIDEGDAFPDPATRYQPEGVHGPSQLVDDAFHWTDEAWTGCPAGKLVLYELHIGTFSPEGTFDGAVSRLDHLAALGVTAIEVMPIANFPGDRNWGYDGVNLFAPATTYGDPDGFKRLVDAAHRHGIAVILDVVYNHFGPEGNYLHAFTGGRFFTERHHTPWGAGVNFDGPESGPVREFVLQNALYWLNDFHVDGLRLDATHAILDDSEVHILAELTDRVRALPGRHRYLFAEDERHDRRLLLPRSEGGYGLDGVWADDLHHHLRRRLAGDHEGYFARYTGAASDIAHALRVGWWRTEGAGGDIDSEAGPVRDARDVQENDSRVAAAAGEKAGSHGLESRHFVQCIQNHDQVGNRAFGERLNHQIDPAAYRAVSALLLAAPSTPLLWMGQEWSASSPFLYFTDHPEELGRLVTEGRREEFSHFFDFRDPVRRERIPDPQALGSFAASRLRWEEREREGHRGTLELYRALLALRLDRAALGAIGSGSAEVAAVSDSAIVIRRRGGNDDLLVLVNLDGELNLQVEGAPMTAPPPGSRWRLLLTTDDPRFGGSGHEPLIPDEKRAQLAGPAAVFLELEPG